MADGEGNNGVVCICCCFLVVIVAFFGITSGDHSSSSTDIIIVNDTVLEQESLPILNMTNITLKPSKITFVYYDHNTTKFNGCYGLNYTVITAEDGTQYMLDHAETDILGEKTNYTFKYPEGIGLVYDNNTETEIYNQSGYYYVHEIRDDNGTVIKELGNFTLHDTSHEPTFIPTNWTFKYYDYNSTTYDGDDGLWEAVTSNAIGNHEQEVRFADELVIGLMYYSNNSTDFYKYGFNGYGFDDLESHHVNGTSIHGYYDDGYYLSGFSITLPNGTEIKSFSIKSKYLSKGEKEFLQDYQNRREEYLIQENTNAIYEAQDDSYGSYVRYQESKSSKGHTSYYYGSNGYGIIRSY